MFIAYFHHFNELQKFLNVALDFNITQAKDWCQKGIIKMAMSPAL